MTQTDHFLALWIEARTRFVNQLTNLNQNDLRKKLPNSPNSAGFLIRHIGEVELLFAKNVFGSTSASMIARTVIDKKDTGVWTNLDELVTLVNDSFEALKACVAMQSETDWSSEVTTKEFGTKTKAEAFGRIVSHTAYHAGQLALILKYGGN